MTSDVLCGVDGWLTTASHFLEQLPLTSSISSVGLHLQVRNSGIRTLFLAVGSQAGRFSTAVWSHCIWEILQPIVHYSHFMGDSSSPEEAAAVELGKEKGKAVMMLVHHSRNSEKKQW